MIKKKHGLLYLLERSAELLERSAEEIRLAHTIGGCWPSHDEHGAKRDFQELREIAKRLRKSHKYHKPNFLGGPAKMFDAIADRIRAGDSMRGCMSDYGLEFKRSNVQIEGLAATKRDRSPESSTTAGRKENAYRTVPLECRVRHR